MSNDEKRKLAAFDIEIAREIPEGAKDWKPYRPLGISCAAIQLSHDDPRGRTLFHQGRPQMAQDDCVLLVAELMSLVKDGYTLVTFNGLNFDFDILAEESGLVEECAMLARSHVDLMFIVVATRGHYLGLDTACKGMGVEGKLKEVQLASGEMLSGMDGARAPELWAAGEYDAVLDYLADDVRSTLELAEAIAEQRAICWTARSGRPNIVRVPKLYTVEECLALPEPDTSWMSDPPRREDFLAWTEDEIQMM